MFKFHWWSSTLKYLYVVRQAKVKVVNEKRSTETWKQESKTEKSNERKVKMISVNPNLDSDFYSESLFTYNRKDQRGFSPLKLTLVK